MPLTALLLALAAAVVHAGWNLLTAGARQTHAATSVALCVGALAFAPAAALTWRVETAALPYACASVALELAYFALLATAYARGPLSVVYPIARADAAPVAAVRETSIVIATVLAAPLLRERVGRVRACGAAVVFAGVALVALG